jgi:type I restriction enzyme M protein
LRALRIFWEGSSMGSLLAELTRLNNHLYANEGLSKEVVFRDLSKVIAIKLYAERKGYGSLDVGASPEERLTQLRILGAELGQALQLPDFTAFSLSDGVLAAVLKSLDRFRFSELGTDFLSDTYQTLFTRYHRGGRGEFHTPYPVARLAVRLARPGPSERLIDPAAGAGGFLLLAARLLDSASKGEDRSDWSVEEYVRKNLWAVEINPEMVFFLKLRFFIEHGVEPRAVSGNGLTFALENEESFDIVITNPPFGTRGKVADPSVLEGYELAKGWKKVGGEWVVDHRTPPRPRPPEILFLEASIRLLKPGGRLVAVVPDGILQNSQTGYVRFWLKKKAKLLSVVSLPGVTFTPYGTGVKTSLVVLEKLAQRGAQAPQRVFFAVSSNVGYDRRGNPLPGADLEAIGEAFEGWLRGEWEDARREHPRKKTAFLVEEGALGERWDAEHHSPTRPPPGGRGFAGIPRLEQSPEEGAQTCKLSEVVAFKETRLSRRSLDPDMEIPYIEISGILPSIPLIGRAERLPVKDLPSRATYVVNTGDILLAIAGASTGTEKQAVAWVTEEHDGAVCTNGFAVLRPLPERVNPYFLLVYFYSGAFLGELRRLLKGHAIPAASLSEVKDMVIRLPPRPVQDLIGEEVRRAVEDLKRGLERLRNAKGEVNSLAARLSIGEP